MHKFKAGHCHVRRALPLIFFVVGAELICLAQASPAYLADYHAVVTFATDSEATVMTTLRIEPGNKVPNVLIARSNDQKLSGITASNARVALPFTAIEAPGALLLRFARVADASLAPIEIRYSVISHDRLQRIPLPVLNVPVLPQQRPVTVEANLADGMTAIGEGFPALIWQTAVHGEAQLPAVPSVLSLDVRNASSVTWISRVLTPSGLSTIGMFSFLCAGSMIWYFRARPAQRAL